MGSDIAGACLVVACPARPFRGHDDRVDAAGRRGGAACGSRMGAAAARIDVAASSSARSDASDGHAAGQRAVQNAAASCGGAAICVDRLPSAGDAPSGHHAVATGVTPDDIVIRTDKCGCARAGGGIAPDLHGNGKRETIVGGCVRGDRPSRHPESVCGGRTAADDVDLVGSGEATSGGSLPADVPGADATTTGQPPVARGRFRAVADDHGSGPGASISTTLPTVRRDERPRPPATAGGARSTRQPTTRLCRGAGGVHHASAATTATATVDAGGARGRRGYAGGMGCGGAGGPVATATVCLPGGARRGAVVAVAPAHADDVSAGGDSATGAAGVAAASGDDGSVRHPFARRVASGGDRGTGCRAGNATSPDARRSFADGG
eukprot:ctg_4402.g495